MTQFSVEQTPKMRRLESKTFQKSPKKPETLKIGLKRWIQKQQTEIQFWQLKNLECLPLTKVTKTQARFVKRGSCKRVQVEDTQRRRTHIHIKCKE